MQDECRNYGKCNHDPTFRLDSERAIRLRYRLRAGGGAHGDTVTYIPMNHTPDLVLMQTISGERVYVDRKALKSGLTYVRVFFRDGEHKGTIIHREKIRRVTP